ncbi:MAG TPA: histidine kinase [Chitinophagaceae bacterium]|nr:histidine kinase [Chitinophagaceae bacterium]
MQIPFHLLLLYILVFGISVSLGFYTLSRAKRLFLFIKPELLRRNVVTYTIGLLFFFALGHLIPDFHNFFHNFGLFKGLLLCMGIVVLNVSVPYNIVLYFTENKRFQYLRPAVLHLLIFSAIVLTTIILNGTVNYWMNASGRFIKYSAAWSFYISGLGALIYLFIRQNDLEKRKILFEKELELLRLSELKTKADLDVLQAKINPHFLYNALNSIADLSLADGAKARQMAISLADLFRYSINYSNSNYSNIREEVETAKLYLQIEKIRFEEKLNYTIDVDKEAEEHEVPRFILQPIIENAVKHGLKNLDNTIIEVVINYKDEQLIIQVYDNGPQFPEDLVAGYGLKSIFDKLELLFPGRYEVAMHNEPRKCFEIILRKKSSMNV